MSRVGAFCLAVALAVVIGCQTATRPSSPESLAQAFRRAYNANDMEAIRALFYTRDFNPGVFEVMMNHFKFGTALGEKVSRVDLAPFAGEGGASFRERGIQLTLEPELVLRAQHHGPNNEETHSTVIPMGRADGQWYLAAPR
jgi:hypothetical protein